MTQQPTCYCAICQYSQPDEYIRELNALARLGFSFLWQGFLQDSRASSTSLQLPCCSWTWDYLAHKIKTILYGSQDESSSYIIRKNESLNLNRFERHARTQISVHNCKSRTINEKIPLIYQVAFPILFVKNQIYLLHLVFQWSYPLKCGRISKTVHRIL